MSTSTHLPLCVYCGTARPADQTRCPQCGRPWIDVRVGAQTEDRVPVMAGAAVVAAVGAEATVETPAVSPPPPPPPMPASENSDVPPTNEERHGDPGGRFKWLIPAIIAGIAVVVIALFAFGALDGTDDTTAVPATTLPPVPTTAVPTTVPPAPVTTVAPTTTSTTTTTIPESSSFEPAGAAISASSLTLTANGIGPIAFDDAASEAIGRLVASLGKPEEIGVAGEEMGLCAGDDGRFVRWAGLTVVVAGTFADGTFTGYRYGTEAVPTMHLDLATPSGLRIGDPVSTLNQIYSSYQIDYVSSDGTNLFRLSDADGLLLWGPVSSIEDSGRVDGIYAPDTCSS